MELGSASWLDVEPLAGRGTIVLIPIGSTEQHGPHLPLETDSIIATEVAKRVADRCNALVVPPILFGFSPEHMDFPGTISLGVETLSRVIEDVCRSLKHHGFQKAIVVNGHGGNRALLEVLAQKLKVDMAIQLFVFTLMDLVKEKFAQVRDSPQGEVGHADEAETSLMLFLAPSRVKLNKAVREVPKLGPGLEFEGTAQGNPAFGWMAKELTSSGVMGNPLLASPEKGRVLTEHMVDSIAKFALSIKHMPRRSMQ